MKLNWNNIGRGLKDVADAVIDKRIKDDLKSVNSAGVEEYDPSPAPAMQEGMEPDVYAPTEIAAGAPVQQAGLKRYRLLGQESDKPFTDDQINDIRMQRTADVYAKHGLTDKAFAINQHLSAQRRLRAKDARDAEEFDWKKADRAASDATAARDAKVRNATQLNYRNLREAQDASGHAARFQGDMAGVVAGKGLDKAIREAAGPDATPDEIEAAIQAFSGSLDEATRTHNAAGMDNFYKTQAQIFGEIGGDPKKAAEALKMAEAEGVPKLIESLKAGRVDEANKLWNSTGMGRGIIRSVGQDGKTGDLFAKVIDPYSGKPIGPNGYVNISAIERAMMSASDAAKLSETHSKIKENEAQARSADASAGEHRAKTEQLGIENKHMRENDGEKPGKDGYKVEASEVSSALGTPAYEKDGKTPKADPFTGRQVVNRNVAEENAFYKWMDKSGIKDTNKALAKWKGGERDKYLKENPLPKPRPTKAFNPTEFMK